MSKVRGKSLAPIAVVGMACRLPGGIDSPQKLWEALVRGDDLITEVPADRWDIEEYFDPQRGVPGRSISRWGAFLDEPTAFDAPFFGLDEDKAARIDPQHRLLMETSWEAIEHAGIDPTSLAGSSTGVYLGISHDDHTGRAYNAGVYGYTETASCMASGRVAYVLNVNGPALTFDTACSSGLTAVHVAARGLVSGETDLAVAGGCLVMTEPRTNVWASAQGMLSPTGRCKAFDESADGFVRSEGCAVLLLKRLEDAQRDGDNILAVLRSTAANSDGRTRNIATPSMDAQIAAGRAALAAAGVDPDTIGVVEAHGTGTPVGDPIEFGSLATTYGKSGTVLLGSAKSNFGHTEAAAGAVGLIKAILEIQHGAVPPMVHFSRLPEKLAGIETGLTVPREVTPWPAGHGDVRRAAVCSYGISGTNVHAILEQAPQVERPEAGNADAVDGPMVFALSSTSPEGLRKTAGQLADWVADDANAVPLADLAYTLARRRGHRPVRAGVVADGRSGLVDALRAVASGDEPRPASVGRDDRGPVWVFSGQGSQWAGMGAELLASEPAFAATIAELEPLIAAESGFSITETLLAPETVTGIEKIQPSIFAMQVGMAAAMKSHGVRPGAVIGQSLGEVAAAVVAGALSLHDGVKVICRRSLLCREIAGGGTMASVELPAQQVRAELEAKGIEDVTIAVVASPHSTVIGGAVETVRQLVSAWEQRDTMAREIAVDVASHTPHVESVLAELGVLLNDITPMVPEVPYYSATLFDSREQPHCDVEYWLDNLRYTVRFSAAVQTALEDGFRVFAELSPHPVVVRAVEQIARSLDVPVAAVAGLRRGQELPHGLLTLLGDLYAAGAAVDPAADLPEGCLVEAPLSAWTHRKLMFEVPVADQTRGGHLVAAHPLLGSHVRLLDEPERHVWRAEVGTAALAWLADHKVDDVPAMPVSAFCEMALAAARTTVGDVAEVWDVRFEHTLELASETSVNATASAQASGVFDFVVETGQGGDRERRASAVLHAVTNPDDDRPADYDIAQLVAALPKRADGAELRRWFQVRGEAFGPAFSALTAVNVAEGSDSMVAEIALPSVIRGQQNAFEVHPALLDACFQSVAAHPGVQVGSGRLAPLGVRRLRAYGSAAKARFCVTRVVQLDGSAVEADIHLVDAFGTVLLAVEGLSMAAVAADNGRLLNERLLGVEWRKATLPALGDDVNPGNWLLVNTSDSSDLLASELADALKLNSADVTMMSWPQHSDHAASAEMLTTHLAESSFGSIVVVSAPRTACSTEQLVYRGADHVRHLVRIARELVEESGEAPRLYVVTRNAQTVRSGERPNLEQAGLRGLLRSIGAEHPQLQPTQIDVDDHTLGRSVVHQMLLGCEEDETAFRNDEWYTARLTQAPFGADDRHTTVVDHERDGMRLEIRNPGDPTTLELTAFERVAPGPGEIEVAVTVSSLNFTDVLVATGQYPSEGGSTHLGSDFAGVVTAVGPGVKAHRVGDHVGGFSPNGCWSTFVTCDADLAVALPRGLRDDQAAAVTTAAATAWHALQDLARIKAGDKVLIHSATGGVGQAAIAIARRAGATIFATAGSEERRNLLRRMGINHVYDSRGVDFADQIRRDTDGRGVDIVLNSLTGAALEAGMGLLAPGGRFVEIGKTSDQQIGQLPFRRNMSFYSVDLALMCATHPEQVRELLITVYRLAAKGALPQPVTTHYPLTEAADALRAMSAAEHTGKLILSVPRVGHSTVVVPPEQAQVFRADGSYIVTGGLGGLGLFLAAKMAGAGAGRIVLNSRSAPKGPALAEIERMRAAGTEVEVVTGDIALVGTVDRLVAEATASGLPVRGVLHAAAVVEDAILTNISGELIERDWAPKVYGAWHLHRATATQPLDWFCSFSSAAALIGSAGQGAYAAANSWLDAFTQWRRAQGLPATAVAWAAWDAIGAGKHLAESGTTAMIDPEEGAHAFEAMLRHDRAFAGYSPVTGAPWLADLAARSSFGAAFASTADPAMENMGLRAELHALPREEWSLRVRRMVAEQLGLILRTSVDPDRPITDYGLDSLGHLELRTRLEGETGVRVRSADITTVRGLADSLCGSLMGLLASAR